MKNKVSMLLLAVLVFAPLSQGIVAEHRADDDRIAHLEQLLEARRQELRIPAMSCAIVKDQKTKELLMQSRINASIGKAADSTRLFRAYSELYSKGLPDELASKKAITEIVRVPDNADQSVEFTLPQEQTVRVFAIGEGQGGEMFDYGWIEDAASGKRFWEMQQPATKHAGGAGKNRIADAAVTLPAGKYKLRYRSDDSHSFDTWNALPPDINFWGIALYAK